VGNTDTVPGLPRLNRQNGQFRRRSKLGVGSEKSADASAFLGTAGTMAAWRALVGMARMGPRTAWDRNHKLVMQRVFALVT